jgi:transitional endoplasmic reticulum ATPase
LKLLEIYLAKRPLADDVNFESLVDILDGYSGADVRYLCDRAAVIPFMQAIAAKSSGSRDDDAVISMQIIRDVIAETPRSVTKEMLERFEQFDVRS